MNTSGSAGDNDMIAKILSRDRKTLLLFYRRYAPKLSRYIAGKVGNPADAEEILQDTLYAFLEAIRDFQGQSTVQTFLFSICQHKVVDYYRKKKLKHAVFSQMPQLEAIISPIVSPEEELDAVLVKEKIHAVLARLLPRYRQILLLKYLDGLSVAEIAGRLTMTFKSAESQLFRARKAFVEHFISL
jgi:RNA polymerase sigma-70 factor (ECF subfamily)